MPVPKRFLLALPLVLTAAALLVVRQAAVYSQPAGSPPPGDPSVASILVEFGLTDQEPRDWSGSASASGGEILALRNWNPRPGDSIQGKQSWKLATRKGINFRTRPWEKPKLADPAPYMLRPGLVVDVKGGAATKLTFQTKNGSFDVQPFRLDAAKAQAALNGAARIDVVPTAQLLSPDGAESDFATALAMPGGTLWSAWVAYRDKANSVVARRFDGKTWSAPETVSGDHNDIYLVRAGRDGKGGAWLVWSAQVEGNWDLYGRRWDGKAWSAIERLSSAPQPDFYPRMATTSDGVLWLVWQGFRNGRSEIFARRYEGNAWSAEEAVSTSPANDWEPDVAADGQGRVYVAWDSYDKGNYDVMLRKYEGGKWGEASPIAATPKFEAHVTLACDARNRLWAAWNEGGVEWGKDTGFVIKREGTPLYESRWMGLAVMSGGQWQTTAADVNTALPAQLQGYNDLPQLAFDGSRMWLFFRHRLLRIQDTHSNTPAHRAAWQIHGVSYEGSAWSKPLALPFSQGRQDMKAGIVPDGKGGLFAAWPTDNRDFEEFLFNNAQVHAARLPAVKTAPAPARLVALKPPAIEVEPLHPKEKQDLNRIRGYQLRAGNETYRIYRGDTHRHTEFSMDGNNDGSLHETYRYALDAAELDYMLASEHNSAGGPDIDYVNWQLQQTADLFTVEGKFIGFYGYERSLSYPNGHRNILFATRGNPTLPIPAAEQKAKIGAKPLYAYLKKYKGIAISHTSATNMGTDWRDNDPEVEPLVELYQGDRVSAEYEGAPKAAHAASPASAPGGFRPAGYVWNAWAKGYKLGVQVSSDHLSTHISYACTISPEFTRQALLDSMRARRSYGATDNIVLDYRMECGGRQHFQGEIVRGSNCRLVVKVLGTLPVRQVDIIRNNQFIHTRNPNAQEVDFSYTDAEQPSGESYYYVRIIQADDQIAWSSPIWVTR